MEWRLVLLLISGFVTECASAHHFHFVNMTKNWTEAQHYCREKYSDLATIQNMEDMRLMMATAENYDVLAWIGLHEVNQTTGSNWKWKWSYPDEGFYTLGETNFTAWKNHEPNNGDTDGLNEECVELTEEGWNDKACQTQNEFVCYNGNRSGSDSYVLVNERKSWRDAQSYCRENHTDLVSVRNQTENDLIKEKAGAKNVWIGLFRDDWMWSDQRNSSFRYWRPKIPDNPGTDSCAVTSLTEADKGKWGDSNCNEQYPFFCRMDGLKLVSENLSWTEALQYCRKHHMDLVSIFTEETQRLVTKVAKDASTAEVWLGLGYLCPLDIWFWISGEDICYNNWAEGNWTKTEVCGEAERAGAVQSKGEHMWVSLPESTKLNFICATEEFLYI